MLGGGGPATIEELAEADCWALLATRCIGRLAFTEAALPAVFPVVFALHGRRVVLPAVPDGRVATAALGAVVALQVDGRGQAPETGWSVTAVGLARRLGDDRLEAELVGRGLRAWTGTARATWLCLDVGKLSGVRLLRRAC